MLYEYIQNAASDEDRTVPFEELEGLAYIRVNIDNFNLDKFKISVLSKVVQKKGNVSQPGPNQIPNKYYEKCSKLTNYI